MQIALAKLGRAAADAWAAAAHQAVNIGRTDSRPSPSKVAKQESIERCDSRPLGSNIAGQEPRTNGNAVSCNGLPPRHPGPAGLARKASRPESDWTELVASAHRASDAGSDMAINAGRPSLASASDHEAWPRLSPAAPRREAEPATESLAETLQSNNLNGAQGGDLETAGIQPLLRFLAPIMCPISKVRTAVGISLDSADSYAMRCLWW